MLPNALISQLLELYDSVLTITDFHRLAAPLLQQCSTTSFLHDVLSKAILSPAFIHQGHYPQPSLPIYTDPRFTLVANIWFPYPGSTQEISTKALHHHGNIHLTTCTIYGPGYTHWLFHPLENAGKSSSHQTVQLKLSHCLLHKFNDSIHVPPFYIHVPMYPKSLTVTLALWSSDVKPDFRSRLKHIPLFRSTKSFVRRYIPDLLRPFLGLNTYGNLDYYPVQEGFKPIPHRSLCEYSLGPVNHRIQTLLSFIQSIQYDINVPELDRLFLQPLSSDQNQHTFISSLLHKFRDNIRIEPIFTPDLHLNHPLSNFSSDAILRSIQANEISSY